MRRESPGTVSKWVRRWTCKPLWTDCARGRGLAGAEAAPQWGVSAGTIPEIAETLVHSAEAPSGRLIWCVGLEAVMSRDKLSVRCCFRGGDGGTQCSVGADRGHSVRTQWPVIPAAPYPSRYGVDATSGPVGHSVVSSRRSAEIAGVVEVLMGHDVLSGGSVEAGATDYG